jgi:membrane fusion protein, multidrug efflux system
VGTGAAFSLLPAQNATGNWIKVVQRVPVRIALDAKQIVDNPLRVGLSMDAEVDVSNKDGKTLAGAPRTVAPSPAPPVDAQSDAASDNVRRVIAANMGKAGRHVPAEKSARTGASPVAVNTAGAAQAPGANSVAVAR